MVLWSPKKLCKPPASCNHSGLNKNYHNNNNKLVFQGCSECNREGSRSRYSTKYQRSTSGESNKYNKQNEQKKIQSQISHFTSKLHLECIYVGEVATNQTKDILYIYGVSFSTEIGDQ